MRPTRIALMEATERFHFRHRRRVEFADTDLAGVVHFANFFRYVESAEHAFFRSLGSPVYAVEENAHRGWPRLEASCEYLAPARFEQELEICLRIDELRTSSLRYRFSIFVAEAPARAPLARGSFAIVHVDLDPQTRTFRKTRIPADLRSRLEATIAAP